MDSSIENAEEMERSKDFFKELFSDSEKVDDTRAVFFRKMMKKEWRRKEHGRTKGG